MTKHCAARLPFQETEAELRNSREVSPAEQKRNEARATERHLPFARQIAQRYAGRGAELEDLIQVANLALVTAIRRYDPESGPFGAFALTTIHGELKKYFRDFCWVIKPPRRVQELQSQLLHELNSAHPAEQSDSRINELAASVGAEPSTVVEALLARDLYRLPSLDAPAAYDNRPLGDTVADESNPFDIIEQRQSVAPHVRRLGEADRRLLKLRYYDGLTQAEIARIVGRSQMQISRNLARILTSLRADLRGTDAA